LRWPEQPASGRPEGADAPLSTGRYYSWLADLSEQMDRAVLEQAADLRACLQLQGASVAELYSKTAVDQLVLSRCCEQLLEEQTPLSDKAQQWLRNMERGLGSVPGLAELVMAASGGIGS
jgi:hypothetical protein